MQICDIIRLIQAELPGGDELQTVDAIVTGDANQPAHGVAVTFLATRDVLEKAAKVGANFVITHEPTFYNHRDEVAWLEDDPIFLAKKEFLDRNRLVLWRLHDGLHRRHPDGVLEGMVRRLGWSMPEDPLRPSLCQVEALSLEELALHCRHKLGLGPVRVAGDPGMICTQVGLLPGACGGRRQMEMLMRQGADVVICGESPEWETCEYVRDATRSSLAKGLIVLGHANSEEAGMEFFSDQLRALLPGSVPVHYLAAGDPFRSV